MVLFLIFGVSASGQITLKIGAVSEYIWRGLPLSAGDPAPQIMLQYESQNGFYSGLWVSDIDQVRDLETNLFMGWQRKTQSELGLDLGIRYYSYLTETSKNFISFNQDNLERFEAHLKLSYRIAYLQYHHEFKTDAEYLKAGVSADLPYDLKLVAHYGLIRPQEQRGFILSGDYEDYKVGLIKTWRGFDFEIAYTGIEAPWEQGDLVVGIAKTWTFLD